MLQQTNLQVIVLAAGKGTRMHSPLPKVLHQAGGLPLIGHVLNAVQLLNPQQTTVVVSPKLPEVENYVQSYDFVKIAYQQQPLGTAHAVLCGLSQLPNTEQSTLLILFGDTPLIQVQTLQACINVFSTTCSQTSVMVVGIRPKNRKNYGQILVNEAQEVIEIIEYKQASYDILTQNLCNSGVMMLRGSTAESLLKAIKKNELSQEYYLTDIVNIAHQQGRRVQLHIHEDAEELEGVNNCLELADIEASLQQRWRQKALRHGVTMVDPESVYLSHDTILAPGVKLYPHVFIGCGVQIKTDVEVFPFTHIEGTIIKEGSKIGPYARLRPGTVIEQQAKIGNFVEIKNTHFGAKAKANHLSYIGDAEVGEMTNIGAGSITANFDGYQKWPTKIGHNVAVGANCSIVAPIVIGHGVVIGAGSTLTKDVPDQSLVIARPSQKHFDHKGQDYRQQTKKLNTSKN